MATIKATTAVDLTHLDFGAIFAARTGFLFQDNANVVSAGGVTYEDMLKLTLPGGSFSFGGAGLVVDSTGLLLNGGSITGLFGSSGGTAGYSIEGIFLSGTLVRNAAATPGTTDDDQQLASALGQADSFTLSAGNDRADGFAGNDTIRGGAGNDTLAGGAGRDSLLGGTGNDRLDGGGDLDTLIGGAGNDVYLVDLTNDLVREAAGEGIDTVRSSASTYTLAADVENLALSGLYAVEGIGNALGNTITGNAGNNRLWGMLGRDSLAGGAGNDTLNGGGGIDTMTGGGGNDVYALDVAGDVVVEAANGGNDTLITEVSWTLGANVENLQLGTTLSVGWQAHLTGNGNTLDNRITGGGGNNILRGGAGNDTLNGVIGLDTLVGGSGLDTFAFQSVNSPDRNLVTISDFVSADDSLSLNHLAFKKLGAVGALTAGFFHLGSAAGDGDDYLIYNTATGALFYDADGNGFLSQVQIGQFKAGTVIVAADLFVY